MSELNFELDDLGIGDIAVTSMRDAVALPETGASCSVSCVESCSCCTLCYGSTCCRWDVLLAAALIER